MHLRSHRRLPALATITAVLLPLTLVAAPTAASADPAGQPSFTSLAAIPSAKHALAHVKAIVAGRAPAEDLTLALRDLAARLPEYRGADRALAGRLLARPDGGKQRVENALGATWTGNSSHFHKICSGTIPLCVHWTDQGHQAPPHSSGATPPKKVNQTLAVMEHVWQTEVGTFGYRAPLTDERGSFDNADPRFDVYLSDIGSRGYYGYCVPDDSHKKSNYDYGDRSGYCVVDNDFSRQEFPNHTPLENLEVTAAHEFFHAIQFGYDAFEDAWFMEATAAWMEDQVYTSVNDNRQYLQRSQLTDPAKPLDTASGITVYGGWIFFRYLSEKYGRDIVRAAWQNADAAPGGVNAYSMQAVGQALTAKGDDLSDLFADYAVRNLAPGSFYNEGAHYPHPSVGVSKLRGKDDTSGWLSASVDHMATAYGSVKPSRHTPGRGNLRIKVNAPSPSSGARVRVLVKFADGNVRVYRKPLLDHSGSGSWVVPFARHKVDRVYVALVNASHSYKRCFSGSTQYSCSGGVPRQDNRRFSVRFTAVSRVTN